MAKKIKVILDTNLWISFLITKNLSQLDEVLFENKARLVFSEELLEEFLAVIKRPKLSKFFTNNDIEKLLEVIQEYFPPATSPQGTLPLFENHIIVIINQI